MRSASLVVSGDDVTVVDVSCSGGPARWSDEEEMVGLSMVLVRSGTFRRTVHGVEVLADPMTAYLQRPGSVHRIAHPRGGDHCTVIVPSASFIDLLDVHAPGPPRVTVPTRVDLEHRVLLARARRGAEPFELLERAAVLAAGLFWALTAESSRLSLRPPGARARSLAEEARQLLEATPEAGLGELSQALGVSTFHLSRTFRAVTGMTLTRYRRRLRMSLAFERFERGSTDLAGLAADLGFSDQAHFTRIARAETGATPGMLREALRSLAARA